MNIKTAFPSKYLRAADLGTVQPVVVMDHVTMEEVGQSKDQKPVLYFAGKDKGLVLNKTNCNKLIELTGSPVTEEWTGHRIRLYATETQFGGEMVDCIRIKAAPNSTPPIPAPTKTAQHLVIEDDDDDAIPF